MIATVFLILLAATALFAWRRGGRPERAAAAMYVAAAFASDVVVLSAPQHHANVEPGLAVIDVLLLAGLAAIAFRTNRWWPIISTALQLTTVMGHLARALNPDVWRLAYAWMLQASAFPSLMVLALGVYGHMRARRSRPRCSKASSNADAPPRRDSPPNG